MSMQKFGVGQAVRRVEDQRLVTGKGRYTADVVPPRTATGVLVRSPHAHARFKIGDIGAVRAMPGVLLVLTHPDIAHLGPLPCIGTGGVEMPIPEYPVLARDVVRHVGDAVAFIVAETDAQGRDAA